MTTQHHYIEDNLRAIQTRIAQACHRVGRKEDEINLVAVTKFVDVHAARHLVKLGVTHLGENRIEVAREKIEALGPEATWHMIGNIQRRKVRNVIELFHAVDAVDRLSLAESMERHCLEANKTIPILLELNIAGETAKHGFQTQELDGALKAIQHYEHLQVDGLLTMAPLDAEEKVLRHIFHTLRTLADEYGLETRSMGMTNDFEIAIEEGSTQVRIGRALYKVPSQE